MKIISIKNQPAINLKKVNIFSIIDQDSRSAIIFEFDSKTEMWIFNQKRYGKEFKSIANKLYSELIEKYTITQDEQNIEYFES